MKKIRIKKSVREALWREIEGEEKEKKFDHAGKFNQNWLEDISL